MGVSPTVWVMEEWIDDARRAELAQKESMFEDMVALELANCGWYCCTIGTRASYTGTSFSLGALFAPRSSLLAASRCGRRDQLSRFLPPEAPGKPSVFGVEVLKCQLELRHALTVDRPKRIFCCLVFDRHRP